MMKRKRKVSVSGWVRFPTNDPAWENTHEGGTVVKLVVVDETGKWERCFGVPVFDFKSEELLWGDRFKSVEEAEAYHFPKIARRPLSEINFLSRPYLAAVVLGSTNWTGWHKEKGEAWYCTFDDLTDDGKALYRMIQKLYSGADLHILTFIDT